MPGDTEGEAAAMLIPNPGSITNHRKIRKGTRSCWECKRRKIKCIFPSSGEATCIFCHRRRVPCISQEIPESLGKTKEGNRSLGDRMARIEDALKDLLHSKDTEYSGDVGEHPQHKGRCPTHEASGLTPLPVRTPLTPAKSLEDYSLHRALLASVSPAVSASAETDSTNAHPLLAAFPTEEDVKILLFESYRTSRYTLLVYTQPHSQLTPENLGAPFLPEQCFTASTHPVIIAKRMLILAITAQAPCEEFLGLSESPTVLSRRLVTVAVSWLATQDEIHSSVDSLVCIILEAVYETNCGNLRRAWIIYRRAMAVAQTMGLHRSPVPPVKQVDAALNVDLEFIWFRIIYMDRYLSLLLGLPQATSDKSIGVSLNSQFEPPLGQFERQLNIVASLILERNDRNFTTDDIVTTKTIDSKLLQISTNMPASFWRPPNFQTVAVGSPDNLLEAIRLSAHVFYCGLLIQLHLPFMMHGINNNVNPEYSKMTCVNASREILSRFIAHRNFQPKSSCSRPVDFFALQASMTLLLAHLDSHNHHTTTNFLAHQRLSDRAVLDQVLERMDLMRDNNKDVVMRDAGGLIRQLIEIEADAANGGRYNASTLVVDEQDGMKRIADEGCGELRLPIPYLGTIKITRQGTICRELLQQATTIGPYQTPQTNFPSQEPVYNSFASVHHTSPSSNVQEPLNQLQVPPRRSPYPREIMAPAQLNNQLHLEDASAGMHDWAFQGTDVAFFDSLMRAYSDIGQ